MLLQTTVVQTAPAQPMPVGTAVKTSLTAAFTTLFAWLPRIIGFIVIVLIGWFISSLLAKGITAVLRRVRFNEAMDRIGLGDFVAKTGTTTDSSGVVGGVVKWLIRFVVLLVAFDTLGLPAVSDVLRQFLLWLPNLLVALVVLILAGLAARALGNLVRGTAAEAGFTNPDTLANVAKSAVWVFAVIIAVNQVGIATTLVNTLFMGAVGAIALASGLAFGLGGRDLAARTLDGWYESAQNSRPKAERMADRTRGREPL